MLKKLAVLLLILCLLTSCASPQPQTKKYNATFLTLFDTVTTIVGRAESEEAFSQKAQAVHDELLIYRRLFDIYNDYEGIHNLKTVNDQAGIAPVKVDPIIIDLLVDCKAFYELTDGLVNTAMGSVLALWHEARNVGLDDPSHAALPDMQALKAAAEYCSFNAVVIDEEASTVFISDPKVQLDVGAVAKGWAAQKVAETAPDGLLISVGGNVCATKIEDPNVPWVVGINAPDGGSFLHTLNITSGSVVTSGDYQRYYVVDGKAYHHIIDPKTLMPSDYWRSVTVLCEDSGLGDVLSTALFLLPQAEGQALLTKCGAEAMWVGLDDSEYFSPGFSQYLKN